MSSAGPCWPCTVVHTMAHHVVDEAARAWTYVGMGSLSLLGSSYIIVTYAADRMLHTKTLSMVVCLAVCDFIYTCKVGDQRVPQTHCCTVNHLSLTLLISLARSVCFTCSLLTALSTCRS